MRVKSRSPNLRLDEFRAYLQKRGYAENTIETTLSHVRVVFFSQPHARTSQSRADYRRALRMYFEFLNREVIEGEDY